MMLLRPVLPVVAVAGSAALIECIGRRMGVERGARWFVISISEIVLIIGIIFAWKVPELP